MAPSKRLTLAQPAAGPSTTWSVSSSTSDVLAMSLVSLLKSNGPSGYGYGTTAEVVTQGISLRGKSFLVTGSTSGIGLETVRVLAQRGARVFATGRSREKVLSALGRMPGVFIPLACELSEPSSVRACVAE